MTQSKNTKKALLASVLSLVLSFTMLIGSTFAWFTDSATTGVNKIVAGNLDIKLSYKNPTVADYTEVSSDTTKLFVNEKGEEMLWEPGAVSVCYFKLENLGTLDIKYALSVIAKDVVTNGDAALSKVLKTAVVDMKEGETITDRSTAIAKAKAENATSVLTYERTKSVMEASSTEYFAMVIYFPEEIGNTYEGATYNLSAGATALQTTLQISLNATQASSEKDSYDETYDLKATWPTVVNNAADLNSAMADDKIEEIVIFGGAYDEAVEVAAGKKVTVESAEIDTADKYDIAVSAGKNSNVTLNGGTYTAFEGAQVIDAQQEGAEVVVNGGTYEGNFLTCVDNDAKVTVNDGVFTTPEYPGTVIAMTTGSNVSALVTINGGTFYSEAICDNFIDIVITGGTFYLNEISHYPNMITKDDIIIKGGTFSVDPTNYLAEGYIATQNADNMWVVSAK